MFHPDSYGYRPGRSAHDALRTCRQRCWRYDWVLDLDLKSFFDSLDHSLVLKAVAHHTNLRWILLYVERWLKAPLQLEDGTLQATGSRQPAGLCDLARAGEHLPALRARSVARPGVPGRPVRALRGRCDPALQEQAAGADRARRDHRAVGAGRSGAQSGQDAHRVLQGLEPHRLSRARAVHVPRVHVSSAAGAEQELARSSSASSRRSRTTPRRRSAARSSAGGCTCGAGRPSPTSHSEINPTVRGWINYYGRFYRTELIQTLRRINDYLVRWAMRKYKRLRGHPHTGADGSWRRSPNGSRACSPTGRWRARPTAG